MFAAKTVDELKVKVEEFLASHGVDSVAKIDGDFVYVEIPDSNPEEVERATKEVLAFCRRRDFGKAHKLLNTLIRKAPLCSENYRLLAQVQMEEGNADEAITNDIDALRLNPANLWALILLGNLYAKFKQDDVVARRQYEKALSLYPDSSLALNNLAGLLLKKQEFTDAEKLFRRSINLEKSYLNAWFGLACALRAQGKKQEAFETLVEGMKQGSLRPENDPRLRDALLNELLEVSMELQNPQRDRAVFDEKRALLAARCKRPIQIESKSLEGISAKFENAKRYDRDYHRVVFNPDYKYLAHVLYHEIEHFEMWLDAEENNANVAMLTNTKDFTNFLQETDAYLSKLKKRIDPRELKKLLRNIHEGFSLQLMNCPLDLFVETRIYDQEPTLRPIQFLSMFELVKQGVLAIQQASGSELPKNVTGKSKILNLVSALHLKSLYGADLIDQFNPDGVDLGIARVLYNEYRKAEESFVPGDEYKVLRFFIQQMKCSKWVTTGPESEYVVSEKIEHPGQKDFDERHKDGGGPVVTAMMCMYMLAALKQLKPMPLEKVRTIATEIAYLGMSGISPDNKSGYSIPSLPGQDMGGYLMLAYYYVSWKLAFPEMIHKLNLPFHEAFRQAESLYDNQGGQNG